MTIPNSVTSIGHFAFQNCTGLTSVIIPNSFTSIGDYAFYGCSGLTEVTIPNSVTSIGEGTFASCSGLTSFYGKYASDDHRCLIIEGTLHSFAPAGLTSYNIPNDITSIGEGTFASCSGLTEVIIPNSVTSIGESAFDGCSSLTSVRIPNSVTTIWDSAFDGCTNLTSVIIPNSVTYIGEFAFEGCTGLTEVTIGNSVTSIGKYAFRDCTGLTSVTIPNSVTEIGERAFYGCSGLTDVTIGNSVTSIGSFAFYGCSSLTSVTIPNSVTSIGNYAFRDCSGLTSVTIGNSVTSIGDNAFYYCTGLTSFYGKYASDDHRCLIIEGRLNSFAPSGLTSYVIPNSVTEIGDNAFDGCSGLTSVTIPNSVTSIGDGAFYNCNSLTSVTIPNSVTSIGDGTFYGCSGLTEVTIGNSVTSIGTFAFRGCSSLTSVTIPNSVTSIGGYAFYNCWGLTSVTIPNSVTSIGRSAFYSCRGLTSLTVKNENPSNISLGDNVFYSVPTSTCVLYVPEGSKELYQTADQWKAFENIEEFRYCVSLTDGDSYTATEGQSDVDVNYTRTFGSTDWQSLYIPFNMSYDEWSEYADVAELYNVRSEDKDNDGVIDDIVIEFNKLTEGEIVPNVPYVIKPKATGTVTFECNGKDLLAAPEENGWVECSSTKEVFTLYGVYQPKDFSTPNQTPARLNASAAATTYQLTDGQFVATDEDTVIPAGNIYLAITPKTGGYNPSAAPTRVKLKVIGEEPDLPAGVETIEINNINDNVFYDLTGRSIINPERGIYIVNGKKVLVK